MRVPVCPSVYLLYPLHVLCLLLLLVLLALLPFLLPPLTVIVIEQACGIVVRSRYMRGSIRFVADPASFIPSARFLVATPRTADAACLEAIQNLTLEPRGTLDTAAWASEVSLYLSVSTRLRGRARASEVSN